MMRKEVRVRHLATIAVADALQVAITASQRSLVVVGRASLEPCLKPFDAPALLAWGTGQYPK